MRKKIKELEAKLAAALEETARYRKLFEDASAALARAIAAVPAVQYVVPPHAQPIQILPVYIQPAVNPSIHPWPEGTWCSNAGAPVVSQHILTTLPG